MIEVVTLVSGGLDSTVMAVMFNKFGYKQYPLFVNYGQKANIMEWQACRRVFSKNDLPLPNYLDIANYGKMVDCGLTSGCIDSIIRDAFVPCRNIIFIILAAAYAYQKCVSNIAIGLLSDEDWLFYDQREVFIRKCEEAINVGIGVNINILTPLRNLTKSEIIELSKSYGISDTYSCHVGSEEPCGKCLSCLDLKKKE